MNMGLPSNQDRPNLPVFFLCMERTMKHPTLRYGHAAELRYYAFGMSIKEIADSLHRSERTVRRWLNGEEKIPFWVPELLRLRHYEYQNRMRLMGIGEWQTKLGRVSGDVIDFTHLRQRRLPLDAGPARTEPQELIHPVRILANI